MYCLAGRVSSLKTKYPKISVFIDQFVNADPSKSKKYVPWMTQQLLQGHNVDEIVSAIKFFNNNSKKLAKKDINKYTDLKELQELAQHSGPSKREESIQISQAEVEKLYEDDRYLLLKPKTKRAVQKYGAGTRWCITSDDEAFYTEASSINSRFYFLIDKTKKGKDPYYKIAFRHYGKKGEVNAYLANDKDILPEKIPAYKKLSTIMDNDAATSPPHPIYEIKRGTFPLDKFMSFWNNNIKSHQFLLQYVRPKYHHLIIDENAGFNEINKCILNALRLMELPYKEITPETLKKLFLIIKDQLGRGARKDESARILSIISKHPNTPPQIRGMASDELNKLDYDYDEW